MTDEKPKNGPEPKYQENLPAVVKAVAQSMMAPNIAQRITNLLPDTIALDKFRSVLVHYLAQSPGLHKCTPDSLLLACLDCAESGLLPDRAYGQCWILAYGTQAQFIVGYKGLITLAMNSGKIDSVHAAVVYDTDEFEVWEGTDPKIVHKPNFKIDRAKEIPIAAYAIAYIKNARHPEFAVMSYSEVEKIRKKASSGNSPAWRDSYSEMMRKTPLKRLCKTLPFSVVDKAGQFAAIEDLADETGRAVHIETDYSVIEEEQPQDATAPNETRETAAGGMDRQSTAGTVADTRSVGAEGAQVVEDSAVRRTVSVSNRVDRGSGIAARKPVVSARLKKAVDQVVAEEKKGGPLSKAIENSIKDLAFKDDVPPHDPETGEIIDVPIEGDERDLSDHSSGPDYVTVDSADTGPVELASKGKHVDVDKWVSDIAARLDTFANIQQIAQFETAVKSSRPFTYIKLRAPDALRHFDELCEMRRELLEKR